MPKHELWELLEYLRPPRFEWVELSHEVSAETPHYDGFPALESKDWFTHDKEGVHSVVYSVVTQYGTHADAPDHFIRGGRKLHEIGLDEMILPLCVIDVSAKVAENPDYGLPAEEIAAWEAEHGEIPSGAFVAMRTDWSKRDAADYAGKDETGERHFPGWTIDALRFLCEKRKIAAIGHEPSDTDPAYTLADAQWVGERYLLEQDKYQVELMCNLDRLPPQGGVIFCCFPRVKDAPGFTARCFAVIPASNR